VAVTAIAEIDPEVFIQHLLVGLKQRQQGLWWHQQTPFVMTLLLDDKRMVQSLSGQPPHSAPSGRPETARAANG
jgi:hypothetical protein